MYGDMQARQSGLLDQVEGLRNDIAAVRSDVQAVRADLITHRPQVWLWLLGYAAFLVSGLFWVAAFYSLDEVRLLLTMPGPVALALALLFVVAAALLFAGGFGWLRGG